MARRFEWASHLKWTGLAGVLVFYIVYGFLHAAATRAGGPTLALDDVKLNIVTQSLQGGYMPENPPLFEWFLIAVQQATGPTLLSFSIVKYAFLTAAGGFVYLAAKGALGSRPWAVVCALSLTAVYQIGWNYHQAFTHTTALIALTAAFWAALFVLLARPDKLPDRRPDKSPDRFPEPRAPIHLYAMFGVVLGLGVLSKYSFIAAAALGLGAALARPETRRALRPAGLLVAIVVACIIVMPHAFWLAANNADVAESAAGRLRGEDTAYLVRVGQGLPSALWAIGSYFLPLAPLLAAFIGVRIFSPVVTAPVQANASNAPDENQGLEAFQPSGHPREGGDSRVIRDWKSAEFQHALARLARDASLAGAAALVLAVLVLGMSAMQERYAIPFLFPALFWLTARARGLASMRSDAFVEKAPRRLAGACVGLAGLVLCVRLFALVVVAGPPICSSCRQWIPYDALAAELRAMDLDLGRTTLLAYEDHTAGNLRRLFPEARVVSGHMTYYTAPSRKTAGKAGGAVAGEENRCVFVWSDDLAPPPSPAIVSQFDPAALRVVRAPWRHWRRGEGWRVTQWTIASVVENPALPPDFCRHGVD